MLDAYSGCRGGSRRRGLIRTSTGQSASGLAAITPRWKSQATIPRASPQGYANLLPVTDDAAGHVPALAEWVVVPGEQDAKGRVLNQ